MSRSPLLFMSVTTALLVLGAVPSLAVSRVSGPLAARVTEVVDGDTLAVRVTIWLDQEVITRVRVDGIDTPESRSTCADEKRLAAEAREKLATLVAAATEGKGEGTIRLHDIEHDKYGGRVRARVTLDDGTDVAQAMIKTGRARPYQGGKRQPWCAGT